MKTVLIIFMTYITAAAQASGRITVVPDTIYAEQGGELIVALYTDEASWLDFSQAYRLVKREIASVLKTVVFDSLPPGRYAVQVLHDRDRNGKLGFKWLPPGPTEGSGLSNNNVRMGKPLFEPALMEVKDSAVRVDIIMRY